MKQILDNAEADFWDLIDDGVLLNDAIKLIIDDYPEIDPETLSLYLQSTYEETEE